MWKLLLWCVVFSDFAFLEPWFWFRWGKLGGGVAFLLLGFLLWWRWWRWCRSSWFLCCGISRGVVKGRSNVGIGWDVKLCIVGVLWLLWVVKCVGVCGVGV